MLETEEEEVERIRNWYPEGSKKHRLLDLPVLTKHVELHKLMILESMGGVMIVVPNKIHRSAHNLRESDMERSAERTPKYLYNNSFDVTVLASKNGSYPSGVSIVVCEEELRRSRTITDVELLGFIEGI